MGREIGFPKLTAEYRAQIEASQSKKTELNQGSPQSIVAGDDLFPRLTDEKKRSQNNPDRFLVSRGC